MALQSICFGGSLLTPQCIYYPLNRCGEPYAYSRSNFLLARNRLEIRCIEIHYIVFFSGGQTKIRTRGKQIPLFEPGRLLGPGRISGNLGLVGKSMDRSIENIGNRSFNSSFGFTTERPNRIDILPVPDYRRKRKPQTNPSKIRLNLELLDLCEHDVRCLHRPGPYFHTIFSYVSASFV